MRFNDAVFGVLLMAFAAYVFVSARSFPASVGTLYGPGFVPGILAIGLGVCGLLLTLRGARTLASTGLLQLSPAARRPVTWLGVLIVVASVSLYSYLDDILGFHLTATAVVTSLMTFLWGRPLASLAFGVVVSVVIYLFFAKVLLVPLPLGLAGKLF